MREAIRFNGKINSCTISQSGDKFYAIFSIQIDKNEYMIKHKNSKRTNLALGIDIGLKSFLSLSNGLQINAPKPLNKLNRSIIKRARQLSKKLHPKTKGEVLQGVKKSNNYQKASINLNKLHRKISNIRSDFVHKLTLVANIDYF